MQLSITTLLTFGLSPIASVLGTEDTVFTMKHVGYELVKNGTETSTYINREQGESFMEGVQIHQTVLIEGGNPIYNYDFSNARVVSAEEHAANQALDAEADDNASRFVGLNKYVSACKDWLYGMVADTFSGVTDLVGEIRYQIRHSKRRICDTRDGIHGDYSWSVQTCTSGKSCNDSVSDAVMERGIESVMKDLGGDDSFHICNYQILDLSDDWRFCVTYYKIGESGAMDYVRSTGCPTDWCGPGSGSKYTHNEL